MFGEHTVVNGGKALAIPFSHFSGSWNYNNGNIDRGLIGFADYIDHHDYLFKVIDVDQFFADLDRGLLFESNIPIGYGLGSSGALVAATYRRYRRSDGEKPHRETQQHLADLENHFHGKSSGFDPLVSYLNQAVLVDNGNIITVDSLVLPQDQYQLFLMNTNISRATQPLVDRFQEYILNSSHRKRITQSYQPIVDTAIDAIMSQSSSKLYEAIENISGHQYAYLDFLIDDGSKTIWKEGLSSNYFKIKICGAGGGGYLLGMTTDMARLMHTYPKRDIITII